MDNFDTLMKKKSQSIFGISFTKLYICIFAIVIYSATHAMMFSLHQPYKAFWLITYKHAIVIPPSWIISVIQ
jgi:hypothetical protein